MTSVAALWLPIILSAGAIFMISSVIHMVLPLHKDDFSGLPKEDEVLAGLRTLNVEPGEYMFPRPASMKDMESPEMKAKYELGPVGTMTIRPNGPMAIGRSLIQWFVFSVVISFFAAYCCGMAFAPGESGMNIFRMAFAVAFASYGASSIQNSIWKGTHWKTTGKFMIDATMYAVATAGILAAMWPAAA